MGNTTGERNPAVCALRGVAALAVVILHTCLLAVQTFETTEAEHIFTSLLRNLMMWAVPCFVMVTGALLLDEKREVTISKIYRRYIPRALATLIVFTLVNLLYDVYIGQIEFGAPMYKVYFRQLIFGGGWIHMWYLYLIIGIYILLPAFRAVARLDEKQLGYVILVLFIFQSVLTSVSTLTGKSIAFYVTVSTAYPLYILLGHALYSGKLRLPKWLCLVLLTASVAATSCLTVISVKGQSSLLGSFLGNYASPIIVIFAVSVFLPALSGKGRSDSLIKLIDGCSFEIYLVHIIFIKLIYMHFGVNPYELLGATGIVITALVVYIMSFITGSVIKVLSGFIFHRA